MLISSDFGEMTRMALGFYTKAKLWEDIEKSRRKTLRKTFPGKGCLEVCLSGRKIFIFLYFYICIFFMSLEEFLAEFLLHLSF